MQIDKRPEETNFEWKLRISKAKIAKEIDYDWQELADMMNLGISGDHYRKISYGYMEYDEYIHSNEGVATRILSASDFHIPFHLPKETFADYVGRIDILQLNGDLLDCQSISSFDKMYRISFMEELITARAYFMELIRYLNVNCVVVNNGNHDLRLKAYLAKNIQGDLKELMPDSPLDLIFEDGFFHYDKRNHAKVWYEPLNQAMPDVEFQYNSDIKSKIGKTWFVHPIAFKSGILSTSEKVMDHLFKTDSDGFDAVVTAHTHAYGDSKRGYVRLIETGACCKVEEMKYAARKMMNPQKKGFAIICLDESGSIINAKSKIIQLN